MLNRALRLVRNRPALQNRLAANFADNPGTPPEDGNTKLNQILPEQNKDPTKKFLFGVAKSAAPDNVANLSSSASQEDNQASKKNNQKNEKAPGPGDAKNPAQQSVQQAQNKGTPQARKRSEETDYKSKILSFPTKEQEV